MDNLWHTKDRDDVLVQLDTPLGGLSSSDAKIRLEQYGENKLIEPVRTHWLIRFL